MTIKQPIKQTVSLRAKAKAKTSKRPVKATKEDQEPQVPDYYLTDTPVQPGRASIKIEVNKSKATADVSVPAAHLSKFTGLAVGTLAVLAPVLTVGISCYAGLSAGAVIAVTAMTAGISLIALLLLFYTIHKDQHRPS